MRRLLSAMTNLTQRFIPDAFVMSVLLALLVMVLAVTVQHKNPLDVIDYWGNGFWALLSFTMQVATILLAGYALATSPLIEKALDAIVSPVRRPATAIALATVVGGVGSYINFAFGLVLGGIVAKKLAASVPRVHYPLIVTAAYGGFTLYGLGFSATIPLVISTHGHFLESKMGVVPLSETIFSWPMLATAAAVLITLPFINGLMQPRDDAEIITFTDPARPVSDAEGVKDPHARDGVEQKERTFASRLNHSPVVSYAIGLIGLAYTVHHLAQGKPIDLNQINFFLVFLGVLLQGTPARYTARFAEGARTVSGVILQYPIYAGIMAIMAGSGLAGTLSQLFSQVAGTHTLPLLGLLSSFVINFFAPSGGGHWAVQGPFMVDAAQTLGAPLNQTAMAVMLGNAWNDLVQPLWILPALALSNLKLKDVMGYCMVMMLWVGLIYCGVITLWGFWG